MLLIAVHVSFALIAILLLQWERLAKQWKVRSSG